MVGGESPPLIPEPGYCTSPLHTHQTPTPNAHKSYVAPLHCLRSPMLSLSTFLLRSIIHAPLRHLSSAMQNILNDSVLARRKDKNDIYSILSRSLICSF